MLNKDIILGTTMSIFSGVMIFQSNNLVRRNQWDVLGPSGFPSAISWALLGLSILLVISAIRKGVASSNKKQINKLSLITFLIFFAYIFILPYMGFILSTFIFLYALQWILANNPKQSLVPITLISLITTGTVFFVFDKFLFVYLPKLLK